jgi:LysR family transcriptional regulator for metE and metH
MEIKYLRLIKNIVEKGSMAKSTDKLCLTQSALSHQLKELESKAGTPMFIRSGKKLKLTEAGEIAYQTALEVLDKLDDMDAKIREISNGEKGVIRICTACFTNYHWLPALIGQFGKLHPQVEIKIFPEYCNETLERLKCGDLDAVIMNKPNNEKDIRFFEIMNDEMLAIVSPEHEWATKKKYVKALDFEGKNLIIFSKPMNTVVVYDKVLQPAGVEPAHIYEVPMSEAMVEMVASGMGVAVIPAWIARPYIDAGKIAAVRVTPKGLFRSLGIGVLEKEHYPLYYKTLVEFMKEKLSVESSML